MGQGDYRGRPEIYRVGQEIYTVFQNDFCGSGVEGSPYIFSESFTHVLHESFLRGFTP